MKIICTEQEKEDLLDCVCSSQFCPLGRFDCMGIACEECFGDFVEWEVKNENADS